MFAFGSVIGECFVFVQDKEGRIYTWANERVAGEFFESVKNRYHMYQIDNDLSRAMLVERGSVGEAPAEVIPNETQKLLLYESYIYKSLLSWFPMEEML